LAQNLAQERKIIVLTRGANSGANSASDFEPLPKVETLEKALEEEKSKVDALEKALGEEKAKVEDLEAKVKLLRTEVDELKTNEMELKFRQLYFLFESHMMMAIGGEWSPTKTFFLRTAAQAHAAYSVSQGKPKHPDTLQMTSEERRNYESFISRTFNTQNVWATSRDVAQFIKKKKHDKHPSLTLEDLEKFSMSASEQGDSITSTIATHCADMERLLKNSEMIDDED
jgi:hypothetical protein